MRRVDDDASSKLDGLLLSSSHSKRESIMVSVRKLIRNKYLYLFVLGWASLQLALGASHVIGIVMRKIGFDAVSANLLTTV